MVHDAGRLKLRVALAMAKQAPRYIIDVEGKMLSAPLEKGDRDYFLKSILPHLLPMSD